MTMMALARVICTYWSQMVEFVFAPASSVSFIPVVRIRRVGQIFLTRNIRRVEHFHSVLDFNTRCNAHPLSR